MVRRLNPKFLYLLVFCSFVLFVVLPLVTTFFSIFNHNSFLINIKLFRADTFYLLFKSIALSSIVAIVVTIFGLIFGFILYKTQLKFTGFFKIIVLLPLLVSPYVMAVAWRDFFMLFCHCNSDFSSYLIYIWVLITIYTPLSMLIIGSSLLNIDASIEESALLVSSFSQTLRKIIFPLIKPAILTSFVLVFIFSLSEFSVAVVFSIHVYTTEIFTQFSAFYNHEFALMQSLLLSLICVVLLYFERKQLAHTPFSSSRGTGIRHKSYKFGKFYNGHWLLIIWLFITVVLPFLLLSTQSFSNGAHNIIKAYKLLSPAFLHSIILATIGAILIVIIGFFSAYFARSFRRLNTIFSGVMLLFFAIPSSIIGISFIQFYNTPKLNFIYATSAIIIIAYVAKFSFIANRIIANGIKQIPASMDESTQIIGASFSTRLRKIILPLILPSLLITFLLSFIFCLNEIATSIVVYPAGSQILPIKVFTLMANAPLALTSSMNLIVFCISLIFISLMLFVINKYYPKSQKP